MMQGRVMQNGGGFSEEEIRRIEQLFPSQRKTNEMDKVVEEEEEELVLDEQTGFGATQPFSYADLFYTQKEQEGNQSSILMAAKMAVMQAEAKQREKKDDYVSGMLYFYNDGTAFRRAEYTGYIRNGLPEGPNSTLNPVDDTTYAYQGVFKEGFMVVGRRFKRVSSDIKEGYQIDYTGGFNRKMQFTGSGTLRPDPTGPVIRGRFREGVLLAEANT